jgi:signal transduction histidine kinase/DNA-binding NarL/FixJ family response regulator
VGWHVVVAVFDANDVINFDLYDILGMYAGGVVEVLIALGIDMYIYKKAPRKIRKLFWYLNREANQTEIDAEVRKSRLSRTITAMLLAFLIVMNISAVFAVNILIPTLSKDEQVSRYLPEEVTVIGNGDIKALHLSKNVLIFDFKILMLLSSLSVSIGIIVDYTAQKYVSRPIVRMSHALNNFAKVSDEQIDEENQKIKELDLRFRNEIGDLYKELCFLGDKMVERIELIKSEQKLEEDLRVANEMSEAKSLFLSSMSHEIRTPINAVLGLNEMIMRETDDPKVIEYSSNIESSGRTLLSLINDVLDFSKIEAGKIEIIEAEYGLSSLINDLINMIEVKAKSKGLEFNVNVAKDLPSILYGDDVRIKQCALNVLTNAVKYTEKGSVTLKVFKEEISDDEIDLCFSVIDTGIGIKEEDIDKLFSPFERIEESRNRTIEGTGLGMNIVMSLLQLMDSELKVDSIYGAGSEFSFKIHQRIVDAEPIGDFNEAYKRALAAKEKYSVSFKAPKARILVVDDTSINLTVVKGLLKETEMNIETASSGFETLDMTKKKKYDLILLDHRMPSMDGVETLHRMRSDDSNINVKTPCVALTANAGVGAREEYMRIGFDAYLSKPIDTESLEKVIRDLLPDELKVLPGMKEFDKLANKEKIKVETLPEIEGVDINAGINACGNEEIYKDVVIQFRESIEDKVHEIMLSLDTQDYRTYTVLVHALKSSARLVGALELSEMAKSLEEAGDKGNYMYIRLMNNEMTTMYLAYIDRLKPLVDIFSEADEPVDAKEHISDEELDEIWAAIKEMVEAFDYESACDAYDVLKGYILPEVYEERMPDLYKALREVDREKILSLLNMEA